MWRSKIQKIEEYYLVSEMAIMIEMIYLSNLFANMGLQQEDYYTKVFEDNTECIQ